MSPWSELRNLNSSKNKKTETGSSETKSPLPFSKAITTWSCGSTDKAAQRLPPQTQTCPVPVTNRAKKKPRLYYKPPRAPAELKVGVICSEVGSCAAPTLSMGHGVQGAFFFRSTRYPRWLVFSKQNPGALSASAGPAPGCSPVVGGVIHEVFLTHVHFPG